MVAELEIVSGRKRRRTAPRDPSPVIISSGKVGVLVILKCASRSMFASSVGRFVSGKGSPPDRVHVFVRDPIERLRSAYQFFKRTPPIAGSMQTSFTWEEFIDEVLGGATNPHWRPVSETIALAGVDAIPHLFENLDGEYPLGRLDRKNKSTAIAVDTSYRKSDLEDLYKDDYALRAKAGA